MDTTNEGEPRHYSQAAAAAMQHELGEARARLGVVPGRSLYMRASAPLDPEEK